MADLKKMAYRPIGLATSLGAAALAGKLFSIAWSKVSRDGKVPGAMNADDKLRSVLLAAIVQAVIFAAVQSLVDRGGAKVYQRITGVWPGDASDD